jgi:membrane protein insertase Oxa1/YidC/SpoIIIJ
VNPAEPEATREPTVAERRAAAEARTEAKNQAVRETLEPLEPGERPLAVTIGSIAAMLLAIGNIVALLLSDTSGKDQSQAVIQSLLIFGVLVAASIGMWFKRYWAVLGFQTILGLQIIVYSLALLRAETIWIVFLFVAIVVASSVLFWYLIRAMARLQMPESPEMKALREKYEATDADQAEAEALLAKEEENG